MINQKELKRLFNYDADTGHFIRIIKTSNCVNIGDIAGTIRNGYVIISIDRKNYRAHRLAWLYMTGKWPDLDIDHINGIRNDNKFINLRNVSRSINIQNMKSAKSQSKTGVLGVFYDGNKFKSQIGIDGKTIYLGCFKTQELAHQAYLSAKRELHKGYTI